MSSSLLPADFSPLYYLYFQLVHTAKQDFISHLKLFVIPKKKALGRSIVWIRRNRFHSIPTRPFSKPIFCPRELLDVELRESNCTSFLFINSSQSTQRFERFALPYFVVKEFFNNIFVGVFIIATTDVCVCLLRDQDFVVRLL